MPKPVPVTLPVGQGLLVPADRIARVRDAEAAAALARSLLAHEGHAQTIRRRLAVAPTLAEEDLLRIVADALLHDVLRVVRIEDEPRLLDAPEVVELSDLAGGVDSEPT
jgi:hypothetical protein